MVVFQLQKLRSGPKDMYLDHYDNCISVPTIRTMFFRFGPTLSLMARLIVREHTSEGERAQPDGLGVLLYLASCPWLPTLEVGCS